MKVENEDSTEPKGICKSARIDILTHVFKLFPK